MFILRFPQLAVSAKLLCLLMVICGAVPSMVRSEELCSSFGGKFVLIDDQGRVFAAEKKTYGEKYLNLKIESIDFTIRNILSPQTQRYICFNKHWKLTGIKKNREPQFTTRCQFKEGINERGYTTFQSVADPTVFLAFDRQGKALRPLRERIGKQGRTLRKRKHNPKSEEFLKLGGSLEEKILHHNAKLSGIKDVRSVPNKTRHKHARKRGDY